MNTDRIKKIQQETAYPESVSVQQALLKVWNECEQGKRQVNSVDLADVVGRSEQLAEHKCKFYVNADWTYLRCECGQRLEPKG